MNRSAGLAAFAVGGLSFAVFAHAGCSNGETQNSALEEPIRVRNGAFYYGALPGTPPVDEDAGAPTDDGGDAGAPRALRVTSIESQNNIVYPGQAGKKLAGRATDDARAIGMRFADLGTGYWTFAVDVPDPQAPGEITWESVSDFASNLEPGLHKLRFVALDGNGVAGEQRDLKICVPSAINALHPCSAKSKTPEALIELTWDRNVDLDLLVTTPEGKVVSPKRPSSAQPDADGGITVDPKKDGILELDSNGACVIDGQNREELAWAAYPTEGTYQIRVNLFDSCGQPNVRFTVKVFAAEGEGEDRLLVKKFERSGFLTENDIDSNAQTGLFVTEFIY